MEEVGRKAKVGQGLHDERNEGHAEGLGWNAEQSQFGDRATSGHAMICNWPLALTPSSLTALGLGTLPVSR